MSTPSDKPGITRRLVVMAGPALVPAVGGFVGGLATRFVYDALQTAREQVDLLHLFPTFPEMQLVPGSHHPSLGFHPDVEDAMNGLISIFNGLGKAEALSFDSLVAPSMDRDLLLLGGPISNEVSRKLHGHQFTGEKISPLPANRSGFRWHFHYPEKSQNDPLNGRYVGGEYRLTMPKEIIDTQAPQSGSRIFSECGEDGLIKNDYLLITVQPNPLHPSKLVLEVADLNGQGDKAFAALLKDSGFRKQVHGEVRNARCYQVLCEVKVHHDIGVRATKHGAARIKGIARLP